ncbi:MAG TPA: hypothetical protein VLU25_03270 [Acidobacteriota bacterium]|nr:hypothetical protein [Acidobacteriota bacterium]
MKKLLIGCALLVVVVGIGIAVGSYFFVYKPLSDAYAEVTAFAEEYNRVEQQVENTRPYPIPANGLLDAAQVERFVAVQRDIRSQLGEEYQRMEDKYRSKKGSDMGVMDYLSFFTDMRGLILEAKRAQVEAINRQGFSMEEYRWVRRSCYQALGADIANSAIDEIVRAAKQSDISGVDLSKLEESKTQTAPQHNIDLLKPYRDEWQNWAPYGWLGI